MTEDEDRRTPGPGSADATPRMAPHLRVGEVRQGSKPGTRYVRVTSTEDRPFRRTGATRWEATLAAQQPHTRLGRWLTAARYAILGMPLATSRSMEQRLSKLKALAVFSSDALSSTAYATEEMLLVLVLVGAAHLYLALPVSITIVALMLMVVVSYRQAIRAYPKGGGAYAVARENLGLWPGVIAAASLMVDYILTVAVSVSAGVAAITSFLPELLDYRVEMALVFVALLSLGNLRGLRESGTIFAVPTYVFLLAFGSMLVAGVARLAFGDTAGRWRSRRRRGRRWRPPVRSGCSSSCGLSHRAQRPSPGWRRSRMAYPRSNHRRLGTRPQHCSGWVASWRYSSSALRSSLSGSALCRSNTKP